MADAKSGRIVVVTVLATLLAGAIAPALPAADSKPNFTGEWKLDASKSDFGPMPAPESVRQSIVHKEPSVEVHAIQVNGAQEQALDFTYRTDGTPTKGKVGENEITNTASWDGAALMIESKLQTPARVLTFKERWTLAPDGKSMLILRTVITDLGDIQFKIALLKQ